MFWLTATLAGAALGLAYFAALWLTVRRLARGDWGVGAMAASLAARITLVGVAFYGLSQFGAGAALAALAGFLLARELLIRSLRCGAGVPPAADGLCCSVDVPPAPDSP
jgi:F1F0 ATPase subunit 2